MAKTSKKILPWLLSFIAAILLMTGIFAVEASAAVSGDYEYTVTDGKAEITDYTGTAKEISIPSKLGGYPVTSIGDRAFIWCESLTSVTIGNSVTSIGDKAFCFCGSLESITIPDSVTSIGDYAFEHCESLESITIPDSVTSIGDGAFSNCTSLTSIDASSSNKYFSSLDGVLFDKNKKTLITYPAGKKETTYIFPDSVTSIRCSAFCGCTSLTSITIGNSVTSIGDWAFGWCTSLTSVTIGNSVTSIGKSAFYFCKSLTSITIPDSVTSIGKSAFYCCTSLTSIDTSSSNEYFSSSDGVLFDKNKKTLITYPAGKKETTYIIPDSVTSIGDYAFSKCKSLTSITIPDSVTTIGECAFSLCESLKSITIPDSVTSIGGGAFYCCESLTSITIPDSVTSIGDSAFYFCESLTSITIPDSVTSIGGSAFYCCTSLKDVYYAGSASDWQNIKIGSRNDCLLNATIHYNYVPALPKPTILGIKPGENKVKLEWKAVKGATKYRVCYRLTGATSWITKDITTTSYTITGLTNGRKYDILVLAGNASGWSKWTSADIVNATPVAPAPALPTVRYSAGNARIALAWNAVSGATKYRVCYRLTGATSWTTKDITATSYAITGLTNGRKYDILVLAGNATGWSKWTSSNIVNATPVAPALALPTVRYSAGNARIALAWNAVSGATKYRVCYRLTGATSWTTKDITTTSYTITGLTNGKEYDFIVIAGNASGWSKWTSANIFNVTPVGASVVPALPTVRYSVGNARVALAWNAVSGATKYRVCYRLKGAKSWTTKDITSTTFAVEGLTNGREYEILVLAGNATGWSKWTTSNILTVTPKA